ncbi:MAG: hypothetical protein JXQ90_23190 [Cyclobacteriaceae bacterium]
MVAANRFRDDTKHLMIKGAILGVTGIKKILLQGYNSFSGSKVLVPFDTIEEAVEYVTKD